MDSRITKGIKINQKLTIATVSSSCVGCMSWETPYIRFSNGWKWQSDIIESKYNLANRYDLEGKEVFINAFLYGTHLRRVKITI